MTIQGQQDVVQLQITVDDAILVEVLERQQNFSRVEPALVSLLSALQRTSAVWIRELTVLSSGRTARAEYEASDHHR